MEVGQVVIWVAFSGNYSGSLCTSTTVNTTFMNLYNEDFNQNIEDRARFQVEIQKPKITQQ